MGIPTKFYQKDIPKPSFAIRYLAPIDKEGRILPIIFRLKRGFAWWLTIPEGFKAVAAVHG